jgi:hypothetical protein
MLGSGDMTINYLDPELVAGPLKSSGGGSGFLSGLLGGAAGGSSLGPLGMIGGAALGAIGSGLNAWAQNKQTAADERYRNKTFAHQKEMDLLQQRNAERGLGMNALQMMRDNFSTALYRTMGRY